MLIRELVDGLEDLSTDFAHHCFVPSLFISLFVTLYYIGNIDILQSDKRIVPGSTIRHPTVFAMLHLAWVRMNGNLYVIKEIGR